MKLVLGAIESAWARKNDGRHGSIERRKKFFVDDIVGAGMKISKIPSSEVDLQEKGFLLSPHTAQTDYWCSRSSRGGVLYILNEKRVKLRF